MNMHASLLTIFRTFGLVIGVSVGLAACSGQSSEGLVALAKGYIAKGELGAATIELKNALQKQPDLAEARFLLGKTLLAREDPGGAEVELRKASDLKYPADMVVPLWAKALLQEGESRKVVDQFGAVSLSAPAAIAELKMQLAAAYAEQGAAKASEAAIDAALQSVPEYGPALILKARLLAGKGDLGGAIDLAAKVIQKTPSDSDALRLKGDLLLNGQQDWEAALAVYRSAIVANSGNYEARGAVISGLLSRNDLINAKDEIDALHKLRETHPQTKFYEARLAFQKAEYKIADEQVQQLLKMVPRSPQVLHLAAALALQKGSLLQAEQYLSKALVGMPDYAAARVLLAETYLRSGQDEKALEAIRPLLEGKDPPVRALSLAGAAYMQSGDNARAQEFLARAIKLDPSDVKSRTALAMTRLAQAGGGAFGELESIAASDAGTSADMALINAQIARKDVGSALKAIAQLEKKQPDKPLPHLLRGRALLQQGDWPAARASLEKAVAVDPQFFPAVEALAELDIRDRKPADAEKRFESLLKIDPNNVQALMAMARLRAGASKPKAEVVALLGRGILVNPTDPAPRLMLVNYLLSQSDAKAALNAAQDAAGALPSNAEVLGALGRTQIVTGDFNQAIASLNKAVKQLPRSPLPLILLADAQAAAMEIAAATESLKRALEVAPDNLLAQQKLMGLDLAAERYSEALTTARRVQKQQPKRGVGLSMEGDVELVRKNWPAAAAAYRGALQLEPATAVAQRLYTALRGAGDSVQAETMANAWITGHPNDAAFLTFLGTLGVFEQNYAAAERAFRQLLGLQPDNSAAQNNVAWVTAKLKKPGALALAQTALALRPDEPSYLDTLAMILADENNLAKALEAQKKAVALRPQENIFRLNLARILVKAGDKPAARKELEQLSALGAKFSGQKEVRELLTGL